MNSFLKTAEKLREEYSKVLLQKPLPGEEDDAAVSPVHDNFGGIKSTTVGLSDLSENIRYELLHAPSRIKTVSLVGMAGIGKTHIALEIYQHSLIVQHFDIRVWVRVGPKDQINNITADIVAQIESKPIDLFKIKDVLRFKTLLHKGLHGKRYLIVFDDVWSIRVMDYYKVLLPDDRNGSRVLVTTRLHEVAEYWRAAIHQIPFLNNEESWSLLWQNVFAENYFPPALEKAGRKIAEHCEGLPLLILAVANILRRLDKTEEFWMKVVEKKTNTFTEAYDQIYKVLLPSYEYLPQHLKACFLYLGVFPQSCEILLSKLFNLWVVEDFQKLEDSTSGLMKNLVSRSLVIVCKQSFERYRRMKSCKLHSAYWYLCAEEARKNKLFHVLKKLRDVSIDKPRRLSVQNNMLFGMKEVYESIGAVTSTTRSLLFTDEDHQYPVWICFNKMLLIRVLDGLAIRFYEFPKEVLKLLQLRYLALTHNGELPSSINKLQQLQCLILRRHHNIKFLRDSSCLPEEIWDMQELRHLRIMGSNLPNPSKGAKLPKLVTLYVNANSCTEDVFRSIPNLKKLGIKIELQPDTALETIRCLEHIGLLDELESLKCVVMNPQLRSQLGVAPPEHLSNLSKSMKKLSLNGLGYSWKDMSAIASLPHLQVLKLRCFAFQGSQWETARSELEGPYETKAREKFQRQHGNRIEFSRLEFLLLEDIDLVHWTAQDSLEIEWDEDEKTYNHSCFPSLNHLIIRHCYKLKMIPPQIGDIKTLETMEVDECSTLLVASALEIKKKSKSSHLQLVISSSYEIGDISYLGILADHGKRPMPPMHLTCCVNANSCTEDVFTSIPHHKELGIKIELQLNADAETLRCLEHIGILNELELLECVVVNPQLKSQLVAPPEHLLHLSWCNLKKLSLNGLRYPWKYMSVIGSLVRLQVLKLRCFAFEGPVWEALAGQFQSLEYLLLEDIDLVHWTANSRFVNSKEYLCFPHLRQLIVRHCYKLRVIPREIGEITTLESVVVNDCSPSVVDSAFKIKHNTKSSHLQVRIMTIW